MPAMVSPSREAVPEPPSMAKPSPGYMKRLRNSKTGDELGFRKASMSRASVENFVMNLPNAGAPGPAPRQPAQDTVSSMHEAVSETATAVKTAARQRQ